jgi:hypothetical protein
MLEPCRHFPTQQIYDKEKLQKYIINRKRYKHIFKRLRDILKECEDKFKTLRELTHQLIDEIEGRPPKPKNKNSSEYIDYMEHTKIIQEKIGKHDYVEKLMIAKMKTITDTIDFVLYIGHKLQYNRKKLICQ